MGRANVVDFAVAPRLRTGSPPKSGDRRIVYSETRVNTMFRTRSISTNSDVTCPEASR
jgi:hypothetical protein